MSLESATYVNQLVISNPDGSDPKGQGDDHLRLIKNTLKNTFPNLDSAVNVTPAELNTLVGGNAVFKTGMILLWSGSIATIPAGWAICNGTAGTPNLMDRFVVGAGSAYAVGSTGGTTTHVHNVAVGGTALTINQLPPHSHGPEAGSTGFITNGTGAGNPTGGGTLGTSPATGLTGFGEAHSHTATADTRDHRPPYYALAYIRKT